MSRKLIIAVIIVSLSAMVFGMACDPPPPPPPQDWGCSPGFWKNHTEPMYWGPIATTDLYDGTGYTMLQALELKGGGPIAEIRLGAAAFLNTASGTYCPGD